MSEISPQFTFSPAGVFSFERGQPEIITVTDVPEPFQKKDEDLEIERDYSQDWIKDLPNVLVDDTEPKTKIHVPISESLGEAIEAKDSDKIAELIDAVSVLLPQMRVAGPEQVLSVRGLRVNWASIAVHTQFQRWLNWGDISETEAMRCVKAMALPYGKDVEADTDFKYIQKEEFIVGEGKGFEVRSHFERFNFMRYFEKQGETYQVAGEGHMDRVGLSIPGKSGAKLGVENASRAAIFLANNSSRLYNMNFYNVEYSRQALGLLLGMGSLAYNAESYAGREDVFDEVKWGKPQRWPFPVPRAA